MVDEKIIERDENNKPIVGSYKYGTVDERQEAIDKFKLAALSAFEEELDSLLYNLKNEDEIGINFELTVYDKANYDDRFDGHIYRHGSKQMNLVNQKTIKDLEPVEEENQNGTEV